MIDPVIAIRGRLEEHAGHQRPYILLPDEIAVILDEWRRLQSELAEARAVAAGWTP